jgi:signal transduction histidine kinase
VAAVQLEGAQRLIPAEPQRAAEMVGTVREEVREALRELRRTVATLREPLQTDISLPHSLARLIDSFKQATGLDIQLLLSDDPLDLPHTHRLVLYRAVQEALTNVQRHAQANRVWVSVEVKEPKVVLLVRDDGVGFPGQEQINGFGLRGLRERVSQVAGTMEIESASGEGTQLSIVLPLPVEHENE